MGQHLILANISRHIALSDEEVAHFLLLLKERSLAKKELVLAEGQPCKCLNFVESGILRAFYLDKTGKESTIMFAVTDWWITDMYCFANDLPAMLNIEALEPSRVLQLRKEDLEELYVRVPKFERFFRILLLNAYTREQLRVIENLSLSTEERYTNFMTKYPQVARLVTQKQIASYLGITPEFLSMIRANLRRK